MNLLVYSETSIVLTETFAEMWSQEGVSCPAQEESCWRAGRKAKGSAV